MNDLVKALLGDPENDRSRMQNNTVRRVDHEPGMNDLELTKAKARIQALELAMNPRFWTKEQNDAWCRAIPNLQAAFDAFDALKATVK